MKRMISRILTMALVFSLSGCGIQSAYEIKIRIPAETAETYVYSDVEICPIRNNITLSSPKNSGSTRVILKPVQAPENAACTTVHLMPDTPVKLEVRKGTWLRVGVAASDDPDQDTEVSVLIYNIEVGIS